MISRYTLFRTACAIAIGGLSAPHLSAEEYTFLDVWKTIHNESPLVKKATNELESQKKSEVRSSFHWFPRVYSDAKVYSTNDPGNNFISNLEQRKIKNSDFSPNELNRPGDHVFEYVGIGLDLPLYEGGAKQAIAQSAAKMTQAKELEKTSVEISEYGKLARIYLDLILIKSYEHKLQKLDTEVIETIRRYKIGDLSNPVGHSGKIGLQALSNQIQGLINESEGRRKIDQEKICLLAQSIPPSWSPVIEPRTDFIRKHLQVDDIDRKNESASVPVRSMEAAAASMDIAKEAERARYLPKIGLFGNGGFYSGERGAQTSYTAGIYLQWDLYSPSNFGVLEEANYKVAAAKNGAQQLALQMRTDQSSSQQMIIVLEKNLQLLENSAKLLNSQLKTSKELFQTGAINALQLVEVFARQVDLEVNYFQAESALADAYASLYMSSQVEGAPL